MNEDEFSLTIGDYTLTRLDDDSVWLEHESGEGMQVWNNDFADLIEKHFKEYF